MPFSNLKLIIVDEEHEQTYKQFEPSPRYHARDSSLILANIHNSKVLLGSATPSIESYFNCEESNKFSLVELNERYGNIELPKINIVDLDVTINKILDEMQQSLFDKALIYRDLNTTIVESFEDFKNVLNKKGGFISAHWDGTAKTEELIKKKTKATIRCIPFINNPESGFCIYSGEPSKQRVLFAKAY